MVVELVAADLSCVLCPAGNRSVRSATRDSGYRLQRDEIVMNLQDLELWLAPIAVVMCIVGMLVVIGVLRRWKWLVAPPPSYWPMWGLSFIRITLGARGLITVLYLLGSGLVLIGLLTLAGILFGKLI